MTWTGCPSYQAAYARSASEVADWERKDGAIGLLETVRRVRPTILIGRRRITVPSRRMSSSL